jgi:hypothetical protein
MNELKVVDSITTYSVSGVESPPAHAERLQREAGEPVAWLWVEDPWGANEHRVVFDDPHDSKWTPLYTSPRQLSDAVADPLALKEKP